MNGCCTSAEAAPILCVSISAFGLFCYLHFYLPLGTVLWFKNSVFLGFRDNILAFHAEWRQAREMKASALMHQTYTSGLVQPLCGILTAWNKIEEWEEDGVYDNTTTEHVVMCSHSRMRFIPSPANLLTQNHLFSFQRMVEWASVAPGHRSDLSRTKLLDLNAGNACHQNF